MDRTHRWAQEAYDHWQLSFDGPVATLSMDVQEDAGLSSEYRLKLNSYDLGVDIELADVVVGRAVDGHQLDAGRLQDGEPHLAGTARRPSRRARTTTPRT